MNKKLRKVHINSYEWKYYLKGQRGDIIIFSPAGKRYEVDLRKFLESRGDIDSDYSYEHIGYRIGPADIKKYIVDKIDIKGGINEG